MHNGRQHSYEAFLYSLIPLAYKAMAIKIYTLKLCVGGVALEIGLLVRWLQTSFFCYRRGIEEDVHDICPNINFI